MSPGVSSGMFTQYLWVWNWRQKGQIKPPPVQYLGGVVVLVQHEDPDLHVRPEGGRAQVEGPHGHDVHLHGVYSLLASRTIHKPSPRRESARSQELPSAGPFNNSMREITITRTTACVHQHLYVYRKINNNNMRARTIARTTTTACVQQHLYVYRKINNNTCEQEQQQQQEQQHVHNNICMCTTRSTTTLCAQ